MKKILFVANSDRHILLCHLPYLKMFKDNGYLVHVATNSELNILNCDKKIKLSLRRTPFSLNNIKALLELRKIVKKENYDIISCHTPMGGLLGRGSIIGQNLNTKVFYTAHGFHFYKGANVVNWCLYYQIEKYLSKYTTCILTMNEEDYKIARNKFSCDIYKINGIGYDKERLNIKIKADDLKQKLNLEDKFIVTYIAEISKRKRQKELIKELRKVDLEKENIKILLIGDSIIKKFSKYVEQDKNIVYIDFQKDVGSYLNISDLVISASSQEGLPLNLIEAMACNKMIIATNIRGNKDLIKNNQNGILVENLSNLVSEIIKYKNNPNKKINNDVSKYEIENVLRKSKKIYNKYLKNKLK